MLKKADCVFFITLALLALGAISLWMFLHGPQTGDAPPVRWKPGRLTVSERACCVDRFERLLHTWRQTGSDAPNEVCLAIDTTRRSVWVERKGLPLEGCLVDLLDWMDWTVHRTDANGTRQLADHLRLVRRTAQSKQPLPERIWLVGKSTSGEILALHSDGNSFGSRYGIRPFDSGLKVPVLQDGTNYCASMVVSDAEYHASQSSWAQDDADTALDSEPPGNNIKEHKDAWSKVEKRIYQAIEGQIIRADLELHQLRVVPGPDYSAAHAEATVLKQGLLRDMLDPGAAPSIHLKIDHLGDEVWYIRSGDAPLRRLYGTMQQESPRLEFLVSAGEAIKSKDRSRWIEKGRRIPTGPILPHTKWRMELANGAVVEFLGICESPSAGKQWWGPDGSPLVYQPCLTAQPHGLRVGDRKVFEIAWRIQQPNNTRRLSTHFSFESGFPADNRQPRDRYGVLLADVHHHSQVLDKSWTKTTLTLGADVNSEGLHRVRLKDVSLVPGSDFGFEIEVLK